MTGPVIRSTRANATRAMQNVQRHVKTLSQEMSSGKRNVTSMSSLDRMAFGVIVRLAT